MAAAGTPATDHKYAFKERHPPPDGWTRSRCTPHHAKLDLKIMLRMGGWKDIERNLFQGIIVTISKRC
jgi:hypothetical protein